MSFKTYSGNRRGNVALITVQDALGIRSLEHVVRHSPTGLEWGYGGSGPSDTALSILTDYLGSVEKADLRYQAFKFAFLCEIPADEGFEITSDQIDDWLERNG